MKADELKAALVADKWNVSPDNLAGNRTPAWYAWRPSKSATFCECNDKPPQFVIKPWEAEYYGKVTHSMELELVGERNGLWYKLQAYSMPMGTDKIEEVSTALIRAWESL